MEHDALCFFWFSLAQSSPSLRPFVLVFGPRWSAALIWINITAEEFGSVGKRRERAPRIKEAIQ
jgi:hypothetical protein